ncbi:MAG: type II and III secretion system protein family protein [Pseudomonadota bacterium]
MSLNRLIRTAVLGVACALPLGEAVAQDGSGTLRVVRGATSDAIQVAIDRAIVLETERPVGELSIANPRIADVAVIGDSNLYVLGRATGRTTLTLIGEDGSLLTNVDIAVVPDLQEFKERLGEILPGEEIEVRTANDGIVLSGTVSGARKVAKAIELANRYAPDNVTNLLTVGGSQQVMLQVRFAEMQRSVSKELSSSLGFNFVNGNFGGVGGGNRLIQNNNLANLYDNDASTNVTLGNNQNGAALIGFSAGGLSVDLLLEALETKGMVRTLAEPNIVAISGQDADFLAGGEYPIPVADNDGSVTVDYRPFGVELSFSPTVVDEDLISISLRTAVSSLDTTTQVTVSGITVNAFSVRRAETTVEMRDGQSFAIAGLLQDDFNDSAGQIPWLGDIPVLGALFRSSSFQRRQSELVVIITPHLVTPTEGGDLALPTDRVRIPNERELFLLGRVEGQSDLQSIANQDFEGSYGYVLE